MPSNRRCWNKTLWQRRKLLPQARNHPLEPLQLLQRVQLESFRALSWPCDLLGGAAETRVVGVTREPLCYTTADNRQSVP